MDNQIVTLKERPFDPWIRVHCKTGAEMEKMAEASMVIEASVSEWKSWISLKLPISAQYLLGWASSTKGGY
ncbi:hypothetical protein ACFYKX_20515 [Cytobacillus sp. FJAT-54145]|uniref:Uncharacterized protein n=1 Tax=Cytobacillus spartinae TaxID=3299023 RepID=A0ABW6KFG3_9BACI